LYQNLKLNKAGNLTFYLRHYFTLHYNCETMNQEKTEYEKSQTRSWIRCLL